MNFQIFDDADLRAGDERVNGQSLFHETARRKQDRVVDDVAGQISQIGRSEIGFPTRVRTRNPHAQERMVRPAEPVSNGGSRFRKPQPLALPGISRKLHPTSIAA